MPDVREPLAELHQLQGDVLPPALCEAIRLLESDKFERLTDADILDVANYRAIELENEPFFERAFTPGKQAAASLGFARLLGRDVVLDDLRRLRASLGCMCHRESAAAS
jgi:hypothetical protein